MPQKLNFTKVNLLSFTRKPTGGTLKISSTPTKTVQKAMGWEDFPMWEKSSTPIGKLAASVCEFTPAHSDLVKHAFELTTVAVRDFELIRVQVKKGKTANKAPAHRVELHCSIDFNDPNGARKLEAYMQAVPESVMKVTYEREAEQEELPMQDDDKRQATLEEED